MTEAALNHFHYILDLYRSSGSPERQGWLLQAGEVTNVHRELETEGLIE